jgi:hypothetical protein
VKGAEIAWRTLAQEYVPEPCIVASWLMKGSYYSRVTGEDYWQDEDNVFLRALPRMGVNLCPQWALPRDLEGNASDDVGEMNESWANRLGIREPEEILPIIDALPSDEALEREFDLDAFARGYATDIKRHIDATQGEVLFIEGFGQADFMGPYNDWGYNSYLMALALYPEHLRRYYHYSATRGYLHNLAIVEAVRRYDLAPFVYSGQDICANDGPLCSVRLLDKIYFPELQRAVQPLLDNDIRIIWHCDGNIMPILDRLIDLGVSGLQGFQEEAGVPYPELTKVKSRWGRPLILWGCVSVTTTLPFGSVEDVKAAVRRSFTLAGPGRGFALASTSSIMPDVPDENIETLYRYGAEFGRRYLCEGATA